ncbi:MAG: glutaminase A [Pseudomonadota bacterium]
MTNAKYFFPFRPGRIIAAALVLLLISPLAAVAREASDAKTLQQVVAAAHEQFKDLKDGANADYIPELAKVPSELFGVVIVTAGGGVYAAGDVDTRFAIESVSKPFTAALVMQAHGDANVLVEKIGVEPTGQPFNSILAMEILPARSVNPLVNAGAIASVSLVPAETPAARFAKITDFFQQMAAAELTVMDSVYRSEAATNQGNRAIAYLLQKYGRIYSDPMAALDVYTRQCSIGVTARQLAVMGATLANGGVNPMSGKRVLEQRYVPKVLAIMMTAGFYDESGLWAFTAGLPAKTGVGGGIVAVAPGQMAIVGFSPRLDAAGNSVRAMKAIQAISARLGLNLFGSDR